jgi:hypothetical protein
MTAAASDEPPPSPAVTGMRFAIRIATASRRPNRSFTSAAARAARFPGPSSSGRPGTAHATPPARRETVTSTTSARSSGAIRERRSW